jgi:cystathionine beta-synthase
MITSQWSPQYSCVLNSITGAIGNTPMVRLNQVVEAKNVTLLAKCEFLNPGGSIKDRTALALIQDHEGAGRLKEGGTIVEPTSGNTGVGAALVVAALHKGYRIIVTLPDKMSEEKQNTLRAAGAEVIVTPTSVPPDHPDSYYSVAQRLACEIPGAVMLDQYNNPANPKIHFETTGPEIWEQTEGKVTHLIAGIGTGGTISGIGGYLKKKNPSVQIIAADPVGSILHDYFYTGRIVEAHAYKVEGIGEDILPKALDFTVIDRFVQVTDQASFRMTRRLIREEGLYCGGSSGAAVVVALEVATTATPGSQIVVILPDSISRYTSKILSDTWLSENGF